MSLTAAIEIKPGELQVVLGEQAKSGSPLRIVGALRVQTPDAAEVGERATALRDALKAAGFAPRTAHVVLPRAEANCRKVVLPSSDPTELVSMARFEADRYLPINAERHIVEHALLSKPSVEGTEVLIAAVDEPVALMALESVTGAGLEVSTIGISTLALYRAWAKNAPDINEPALLVHLDEDFTELVLVANGQPVYNRSAPVGIKKLVAEIGSAGPMGFGDSELARLDALEPHRLFLKESGVNPAAAANEPQGAAARSWLLRLLRELRQTVDFARREASAPSPNRVCVTGTGTAIHNICEFLAANTGATVDRWNPWAGFDVADGITGFITPEERLSFAPSAGALLPDVPGAPYPNLIPSSYLEARRVKARKQFLAITGVQVAAILLLAYLLVAQRITHMRDTIAEYKERNQALSKVAADLVAKQQRNQIVRNYIRGQSTPVEILNHISEFEIIPDKVTLTRFEYKKDEYVKVSGHALDIQGVNAMESALRQTGLFTRVSQDQGSNAPIQLPNRGKDGTVLQFSITCELAKPSGRNTRRSGAATVVTN